MSTRRSKSGEAVKPKRTVILAGIDTGGTFTDLVAMADGQLLVHKVPSTPDDPARAVAAGLAEMLGAAAPSQLTYSSTVATNALLEGKGARVALFTNAGFEDLIEIGRQNRAELYALSPSRPAPLVPRAMRYGVAQRTLFDGSESKPLTRAELSRIVSAARRSQAEAFAVCLLHSYANPSAEDAIARALEPLGRPVSVSHRISSEYREFERLSTTVVNAYVAPRMAAHLENLGCRLAGTRLRVMQSNGQAIGLELARAEPVRTILSGPAAGVIGAASLAKTLGTDRFITFDMGGTSTDVSLFDRRPRIRTLSHPNGYAVRTPVIDIHTVGAGGGSIARLDAGGSLRVGPESAGANPGPACYGRGTEGTVTDADLVAGRLVPTSFLGGKMAIYPERARAAIARLARAMKTDTARAARGVIRVVNANMERAIRVITVERGFDPREFAMLAFGGAGPMHACELAMALGIRHVVLPRNPGLLCAWGALGAPLGREYSATVREMEPDFARVMRRAQPLLKRARAELVAEGVRAGDIVEEVFADMRYRGQSYEIEVPVTRDFVERFHEAHRRTFGHAAPEAAVEVVNLRVRSRGAGLEAPPRPVAASRRGLAPVSKIETLAGERRLTVPVYSREHLAEGTRLRGPFVVVELSSTAYVAPEFTMRVDGFGNLHMEA